VKSDSFGRRILRYLSIQSSLGLPAGIVGSPTDARAIAVGDQAVVTLFQERENFKCISDPFHRLFPGSSRQKSDQALRKAAHLSLDARMRVHALRLDPPSQHGFSANPDMPTVAHPLDAVAKSILIPDATAPKVPGLLAASFKMRLGTLLRATYLMVWVAWIAMRFGRVVVDPVFYQVGAPSAIGYGQRAEWAPLEKAATECRVWADNALLVVDELDDLHLECRYPVALVSKLPVQLSNWISDVTVPVWSFCITMMMRAISPKSDPWIILLAYEAVVMAEQSITIKRLCQTYQFKYYLDVEEYTQRHIVKALVLEQYNGRVVRWAHTVMDTPGVALSFLGYHDLFQFGSYEKTALGQTWLPDIRTHDVGIVRNDHRISNNEWVADNFRTLVKHRKSSGGFILSYFLPSDIIGRHAVIKNTLNALLQQMAQRRNWLLIIKPKGKGSFSFVKDMIENQSHFHTSCGTNAAVFVDYDDAGKEVCSAGWLIKQMDLGIGISTVQIESLTYGKPTLHYYPIIQRTPFLNESKKHGLTFDSLDKFEAAVGAWMDNPGQPLPMIAQCREWFDNFNDNRALDRIASVLFSDHATNPRD